MITDFPCGVHPRSTFFEISAVTPRSVQQLPTSLFADYLCSRTQHDQHELYKQYTRAMTPPAAREAIIPESGYVAEYF